MWLSRTSMRRPPATVEVPSDSPRPAVTSFTAASENRAPESAGRSHCKARKRKGASARLSRDLFRPDRVMVRGESTAAVCQNAPSGSHAPGHEIRGARK